MKNLPISFAISFLLVSCGGGGGSEPLLPPTINFTASSSSAVTGTTVTLNWSTSNATECGASTSSGDADFYGTKNISGSQDVEISYGTNSFRLSCTGPGGVSSASVSVEGTQTFNGSAFVPLGQTKIYSGFIFNKSDGSVGCLASIEMELTNDNNFLVIQNYYVNEWRYISYNDTKDGLKLRENFVTNDTDEPGTFYKIPITDSALNGIDVTEVNVNPYAYQADTFKDLEQFSADIKLEVDYGENGYYCNPDIEIGLLAIPNSSPSETDSIFIGTSDNGNGYTFLYLGSKDYLDTYADNLPTESDIFSISWAEMDVYTSYMSNPNIVANDYGFRVQNNLIEVANNGDQDTIQTIIGSRATDSIRVYSNSSSLFYQNDYIAKYLYPLSESWSDQRIFLKADISNDCLRDYMSWRSCNIDDFEILFFTPDKEQLLGFKLGGYNGSNETSNVRIMLNND